MTKALPNLRCLLERITGVLFIASMAFACSAPPMTADSSPADAASDLGASDALDAAGDLAPLDALPPDQLDVNAVDRTSGEPTDIADAGSPDGDSSPVTDSPSDTTPADAMVAWLPVASMAGATGAFDLGAAADGTAVLTWVTSGNLLHAARRIPSVGWQPSVVIQGEYGADPSISVAPGGNALVAVVSQLTVENGGPDYAMLSNGSWGTGTYSNQHNANWYEPLVVALSDNGSALAVWRTDSTFSTVFAQHYVPGTGWGTALAIDTDPSGSWLTLGGAVVDASGNGWAAWQRSMAGSQTGCGTVDIIRFTAAAGWGTASLVDSTASVYTCDPHVASDGAGGAWLAWTRTLVRDAGAPAMQIYARQYLSTGSVFTDIILDGPSSTSLSAPRPAFNASGDGLVAWIRYDGANTTVVCRRLVAGVWLDAETLASISNDYVTSVRAAIDAGGNTVVVWRQQSPPHGTVWAATRIASVATWEAPTQLNTSTDEDLGDPDLAMGGTHVATVAWLETNGPTPGLATRSRE